jgi:5-(carboxyamino)imidazole ribonucleotide synthase
VPSASVAIDLTGTGAARRRFDVGIVGAGQLARMTCLAAWPLGISVAVLGQLGEPAAGVAAGVIEGDWHDADAVARLGAVCGVITLENEFVEASALAAVEAAGTPVRPTAGSVAAVQDKALQKQLLRNAGIPVPIFAVAERASDLQALARDLGWPLMLKARKLGYDGYGNAACHNPVEAADAFARLDRGEGVLVEAFVEFTRELAVMVARRASGEALPYPVAETRQRDHVCHEVLVPAPIDPSDGERAEEIAVHAADTAGAIGVMGVELFALPDGRILVNELAPRPHNSGHYTIEACETSQFENHLRGVLDLPLGRVDMRTPRATMVNLLGTRTGPATVAIAGASAVPGAHIHLYGKAEVRVGRKMGHITTLGGTLEDALKRARQAAALVRL